MLSSGSCPHRRFSCQSINCQNKLTTNKIEQGPGFVTTSYHSELPPSSPILSKPTRPRPPSQAPGSKSLSSGPPQTPRQTNNSRLIRNTPRTRTILPQLPASVIAITNRRIQEQDSINQHPIVHRTVTIRIIRRRTTVARKAARRPDNAHGRGTTGDFQIAEVVVLPVVQFVGAGGGAGGTEVAGSGAVFLAFDAWGVSVRLLGSERGRGDVYLRCSTSR